LGEWSHEEITQVFPKSLSTPCAWSAKPIASMITVGPRSRRSCQRSATRQKHRAAGYASRSAIPASIQERLLPKKNASRRLSESCASCARQTRSCAWRVLFSPRLSSAATSSYEEHLSTDTAVPTAASQFGKPYRSRRRAIGPNEVPRYYETLIPAFRM